MISLEPVIMKKASFIVSAIFFFVFHLQARSQSLPEILDTLQKITDDTTLIRGLNQTVFHFHDPELAIDTLLVALNIMKEAGDKDGQADIYASIAEIYNFQNRYQLALENNKKSTILYRESGNKSGLAYQLVNLAVIQRQMGNLGDAMTNLVESLQISRQINDTTSIVESLLALGFTYMYVEKWEDALKVQQDAFDIYEKRGDSLGIARVYNDMGATNMKAGKLDVALKQHQAALAIRLKSTDYYYTYASYIYIGDIYYHLGLYPESITNYKAAIPFAKLAGDKIGIIKTHIYLGTSYFNLQEYHKALKQFLEALELSYEVEDRTGEAQASLNIAKIYLAWEKPREALSWLQKAEKAAPRSDFLFLENIYESIAESYRKLGDYRNAYTNLLLFNQVKDSMIVAQNLDKVTTLINRLEFENLQALQKESNIKELQIKQAEINRQKIVRNFSLFGMFVILVLAVIFFIRFTEKKKLNSKLNSVLSDLKSTQTQLIHAEKMASLGELTAGIAHEIHNPLNFVLNFSELNTDLIRELKEAIEEDNLDDAKAMLEDIVDNEQKIVLHGKRADSIIRGMLHHSRTGSGKKELTNINALADEYIRMVYHGFLAKDKTFHADFHIELDKNIPKINVLPQEIVRVLLNLINNAFYAVDEKAKDTEFEYIPLVTVKTSLINGTARISVADNGNGIPDDILPKIFQPFFTTKPSGEGTGLGLSLSFDIITKGHSGELQVNTKEGEGTEFIISLPV